MSGLLIVGFLTIIIAGGFFAFKAIKAYDYKKDYTIEAKRLAPKASAILKDLDRLFELNHRTAAYEIESFLQSHSKSIHDIEKLFTKETIFPDILDSNGLYAFKKQISKETLTARLSENNKVYDAIQTLRQFSDQGYQTFLTLTNASHYLSFSEMQSFVPMLKKIQSACEVVKRKAPMFIGDKERFMINLYSNLDYERKRHNESFVQRELSSNEAFFDNVLGGYPLDAQQRDSIVKLEDNCLVIASAGSGKTSTIIGKAKYLVERCHLDPTRILLLTYTRKAADELKNRLNINGLTSSTFHGLAYQIISDVTGLRPSICEESLTINIFYDLLKQNKDFLHAINTYLFDLQSLTGLQHEYDDSFSYFEDRKKFGIQALFPDVDGKIIFTKSEEEKKIVAILTKLGVPFRYENPYEYDTRTPENRQYKPDFTIYYQNAQGQWHWIYLEHFAIDDLGNVPRWFGDGIRGGWKYANQRYNDGIVWKRNLHRQCGTRLIETTSSDFFEGIVEKRLREQLIACGVPIHERSDYELYELMMQRSRKLERSVYTLIQSFITLMKANEVSIDYLLDRLNPQNANKLSPREQFYSDRNRAILGNIIKPFCQEYEKALHYRGEIDFTDCIIQATGYCNNGQWRQYDYILVDEFQDISIDRYKFLQALRSKSPLTKLFCVGDDWQSIFRFAGSDMSLVYEFEKHFGYTEHCKIETTYRFHQPLIDKSSAFILKNKDQKEKMVRPPYNDTQTTYLNFVKCDGDDNKGTLREVERIVAGIPNNCSILLLGRYNYDARSVGYSGQINFNNNQLNVRIHGRNIPFLSVHSAKGLEADVVILVNCNQGAYGFPALIEDDPILDFVLSKSESFPFAEERRLFYVAMTRAKKQMYILYDKQRPSPFIGEFLLRIERGSYLCPRCLEGRITKVRDGVTSIGDSYALFNCSNREGGCDFFEVKYKNLTPPGILITNDMTSRDVENLRERRRKGKKLGFS